MNKKNTSRECYIENHVCKVPLSNGQIVICDEDRFNEVNQRNWSLGSHGYPMASFKCKMTLMHRFLYPEISEIDHINGNKLDNRACNLRPCTRSLNNSNMGKPTTNKSGYKGVSYDQKNKKFVASIKKDGKSIKIGRFLSAEEAARAYDKKALELFGEFVKPNFMKDEIIERIMTDYLPKEVADVSE